MTFVTWSRSAAVTQNVSKRLTWTPPNARGAFMVSKFAAPYLFKAENPHILMLSPPLDMKEKWFAGATAYSMAKFGMSLVVLGLAGEFRNRGVAVNALWPRTTIATSAVQNVLGGDALMRLAHA